MIASDAPLIVITGFWLVAGWLIIVWVRKDFRGDQRTFDAMAAHLASAVRRNCALVYEIRASALAVFDEIEDEGACYAFQLEGKDELTFLSGQEFYEQANFPSLDFSLVFPLAESGQRADMLIEKRGAKAIPQRRLPAIVKATLAFPDDLEVIAGTLDEVETILRA